MNTNKLFKPGKITTLTDGCYGSSGKGKIGSYIAENADSWTFACNTFHPQAGHSIITNEGKKYFYQTLNSCAYLPDQYEKIYIGPAGMIELDAFFREVEENKIPHNKIGISPSVSILQKMDMEFERGRVDLDDNLLPRRSEGTTKRGSTCHGVGACSVRKLLRRSDALYAKDIMNLKEFICDVPSEIMARLDRGESGFGEIAQGFPLSLNHQYFLGYTTSRNVTVSQFMSDMFLPTKYAGPVIVNFRTYPIRINSDKYVAEDGRFLTQDEIDSGEIKYTLIKGDSGPWYPDQTELTWDELTKMSGSKTKIIEQTSVTKQNRRVATFSRQNLREAIKFNDTGDDKYLTINFMNYVDPTMNGLHGGRYLLSSKCKNWINTNIIDILQEMGTELLLIGTGPKTDDIVEY